MATRTFSEAFDLDRIEQNLYGEYITIWGTLTINGETWIIAKAEVDQNDVTRTEYRGYPPDRLRARHGLVYLISDYSPQHVKTQIRKDWS
jgi:hypothetical protein